MPLKTALLCLQNNNIRFTIPANWKDPFERYFYRADYCKVMPTPAFDTRLFACCFTTNPDCEAAWNVYTDDMDNNPCVQFKIYRGQFQKYADKFVGEKRSTLYTGQVSCKQTENDILHLHQKNNKNYPQFFEGFNLDKYLNLMLLKRPFYNYEYEVRYMIHGGNFDYEKDYLDVTIPWSLCLYSIKLPPYCSESNKQKLKEALNDNYDKCNKDYPLCYPQKIDLISNSLYANLNSVRIE